MPEQYTYLAVDLCCILFPLIFSFVPRFYFFREWRFFLLPCVITGLFFVVWDILFTYLGVWSFEPKYLMGAYLFGLPAEEYLFFICIPYACTFTYYCLTKYFTFSTSRRAGFFTWLLIGFLLIAGLVHLSHLYTSFTFLLLAVLLAFLKYRRVRFLPAFFVCFVIILVPFFISNGILTGSIVNRPVVLYNDKYNMGIRMFTIPIEDTFYGMLLLLMNIAGFEWLKKGKQKV